MTRRRKAAFALIPLALLLVGVEAALRVAPNAIAESRRGDVGAVSILCIGDSVTWGWGERPEVAWPRRGLPTAGDKPGQAVTPGARGCA